MCLISTDCTVKCQHRFDLSFLPAFMPVFFSCFSAYCTGLLCIYVNHNANTFAFICATDAHAPTLSLPSICMQTITFIHRPTKRKVRLLLTSKHQLRNIWLNM